MRFGSENRGKTFSDREVRMEEQERTAANSGLLFFLMGAFIGAGIALLYAPKTGQEFRKKHRIWPMMQWAE